MNIYCKSSVALTVLALGAIGSAQIAIPKPVLAPGPLRRAEPIYMQRVRRIDAHHMLHLGPKIPYSPPLFHALRVGSLIFDAFEGNSTNNANPDVPTDGLYGETFIPSSPGSRWFNGNTWDNPFCETFYTNIFPGTVGKTATGFDFLVYNNPTGNTITEVVVFTSGDTFNIATPAPPVDFNDGVELTYGGLTPGGWYSNVDLTTLPLVMPTTTSGWFGIIFATGDDPVSGNPIEASSCQPLLWGTKVLNPSQVSQYEYLDGMGTAGTQTGTPTNLFSFQTGKFSTPTSYTVTRGTETSAHMAAGFLTGQAGNDVVVLQHLQPVTTFNNAEISATVTLDPTTAPTANLVLLRAIVIAKANAIPVTDPTAKMTISMLNNSTGLFDTVFSGPPINAGTDGTLIMCPSIPVANIANYISATNTVQIKVGAKHGLPAITGWKLTVNEIQVDASALGPDPLCPSLAFSTTN